MPRIPAILLPLALVPAFVIPAPAQETSEPPAIDYLKQGEVALLQLSHQDLGWHRGSYDGEMNSVFRFIREGLKLIDKDPTFKYDGEVVIWLHDYLQHHPDEAEALKKRIQDGRVQWGAAYSMPYTSLITSEQLARLMYLGRRWHKKTFNADTTLWYNTDIPGMTAQMPQVLAKAGVDKAYLCRSWNLDGIRTDFLNWSAPDGSSIFCFMMNHYGDHIHWRSGAPRIADDPRKMSEWIAQQEAEYRERKILPILPHVISKDCVPPRDLREMIDRWNQYTEGKELPAMEYGSIAEVMDRVKSSPGADFKRLAGEWPNKWIYEAAPSNYRMFADQRDASRLLCAAEAFSTFRALIEGTWDNYPALPLFDAWKAVDCACHGIAPDSCIETFRKKYAGAKESGQEMLDAALRAIAAQVETTTDPGKTPVVVFNNLSWERTDLVRMPLPPGLKACRVVDGKGKPVPCQITQGKVVFLAKGVPALGYATFYLDASGEPAAGRSPATPSQAWVEPFENDFFRVTPGNQGIASIHDKKLNRELLKTDKFEAAQWMDFAYNGQGAGEHTHIRLPEAASLDGLGVFTTPWSCRESGPLFTEFQSKEVQTDRGKVSFRLRLYDELKRIDLTCVMRDCDEEEARQVRLAFPLSADFEHVAYETPFGKVEIGKDEVQRQLAFQKEKTREEIEAYESLRNTDIPRWKRERHSFYAKTPVRPREIQNWIYAGDGEAGVTIGSSVIAWDYLDASTDPVKYPVLQPVLLCSAYSCSRWKHCWTQPGDHAFTFSIYSHAGDWRNGYRSGVATNNPLIPVVIEANPAGTLPMRRSLLGCSADNVVVTAVKRAEDGDGVAVRFYETEGQEKTQVVLTPFFSLKDARRTNLIEEDAGEMPHNAANATLTVGKYAIETVKLTPKPWAESSTARP